jgi:hypothetical protein
MNSLFRFVLAETHQIFFWKKQRKLAESNIVAQWWPHVALKHTNQDNGHLRARVHARHYPAAKPRQKTRTQYLEHAVDGPFLLVVEEPLERRTAKVVKRVDHRSRVALHRGTLIRMNTHTQIY